MRSNLNNTCNFQGLLHPQTKFTKLFVVFFLCIIFISYMSYKSQKPKVSTPPYPQNNVAKNLVPFKPMYPYLILEDQKCSNVPPFLLLLIPSKPEEPSIRDALRRTWANESLVTSVTITRLFLLGRPSSDEIQDKVILESNNFHDIIQQDFMDTYYNLTIKTLMGIEWVSYFCVNVSYVMKIDTDMFFNPWFLIKNVLQPSSPAKVNFFTGLVVSGVAPFRDKKSKFYISESQYSKELYPTYCSGTGYVFSGDLAEKIYSQARLLEMFPFEDVFVGMCLQSIGIHITTPAGWWFIGEKIDYNRCQFVNLVTVHHFTPDELLKIWPDFTSALDTCKKQ